MVHGSEKTQAFFHRATSAMYVSFSSQTVVSCRILAASAWCSWKDQAKTQLPDVGASVPDSYLTFCQLIPRDARPHIKALKVAQ